MIHVSRRFLPPEIRISTDSFCWIDGNELEEDTSVQREKRNASLR